MNQPASIPAALHAYGWRRPAAAANQQWMETSLDLGGDDFEPVSVLVEVDSYSGSTDIRDVRDHKGNDRSDDMTEKVAKALLVEAKEYVRECRRNAANEAAERRA